MVIMRLFNFQFLHWYHKMIYSFMDIVMFEKATKSNILVKKT